MIPEKRTCKVCYESPYLIISPDSKTEHHTKEIRPLVVILHGYGKNEEIYSSLPPRINETDFYYLVPRAPFPMLNEDGEPGGAWLFTRLGGDDQTGRQVSLRYLKEMIQDTQKKINAKPGGIFLMAFSQAVYTALAFILRDPGFVKKAVLQGGWANMDILKKRLRGGLEDIDFFIQHGTKDTIVPVSYGKELYETIKKNDGQVIYKEYNCGHFYTSEILDDVNLFFQNKPIAGA